MGLPATHRRRTPGLRRAEVAELVGVSVSWYTWLEQGRKIRVSAQLLERVATTLLMTPAEREFLFGLAQQRPPPRIAMPLDPVSPSLESMLGAILVPALVMTSRWDVIAWNDLTRIFRNYDELLPEKRNLLRMVLVEDESYQVDPVRHEQMARHGLSKFRVDYSQNQGNPAFEQLIADLTTESALFRRLWNGPEVMSALEGVGHYPHLGGVSFEVSSYLPDGNSMLRLVIYTPHDTRTEKKVAAWRSACAARMSDSDRDPTARSR